MHIHALTCIYIYICDFAVFFSLAVVGRYFRLSRIFHVLAISVKYLLLWPTSPSPFVFRFTSMRFWLNVLVGPNQRYVRVPICPILFSK